MSPHVKGVVDAWSGCGWTSLGVGASWNGNVPKSLSNLSFSVAIADTEGVELRHFFSSENGAEMRLSAKYF